MRAITPGWGLVAAGALAVATMTSPANAAPPPGAQESRTQTVWLCRPGLNGDPCDGSLRTTDQRTGRVWTPQRAHRPPVDCFYLYPTVSTQTGMNATLAIEAAQRSIAEYQAARFSTVCRVVAPMYRQVTLAGLGGVATRADWRTAYRSARAGWRAYLHRYNHGRGFVLIGHSQGSYLLRKLITREIDDNPALMRRFVGAVLPGTSIAVPRGRLVGGDFRSIPACSRPREAGCVQSWATYNDLTPARNAIFGRLDDRSQRVQKRYEAMCTAPAAIAGGPARYRGLKPSAAPASPFDIGLSIMFSGDVPTAPTPWVKPGAAYRGSCVRKAGSHYLNLRPLGSAPTLIPSPDPRWGLHLLDVNGALPQLLTSVRHQIRSFTRVK